MARHKLSEKQCKELTKPGIYSDGDGLYFRVRPGGSKQWLFVYRWQGARAELGLGGYGQGVAPVSVALARQKAQSLRDQLALGENPKAARENVRRTFADLMEDVIRVKAASFRNAKHRQQWRMTLDTYAKPLHSKPIDAITRDDVVETLKPIWDTVPETADRTRMRIAAVFDHAKARGLVKGDNPAAWRGGLKELLPARQKLTRGHHAALRYQDVPAMIATIRSAAGVSARAVEFACLTAARSGEVRGATFSEIDETEGVWTVPAGRMKAGRVHRVPLSARALEIVKSQRKVATSDLIFEGGSDGRPISDTAMVKALRVASPDKAATLHGLRSSFRDWAGDMTSHARDTIEAALAHVIKDKTEAAYRRLDALEKRRELMADWAMYCERK